MASAGGAVRPATARTRRAARENNRDFNMFSSPGWRRYQNPAPRPPLRFGEGGRGGVSALSAHSLDAVAGRVGRPGAGGDAVARRALVGLLARQDGHAHDPLLPVLD